jgi:hypothetical protein
MAQPVIFCKHTRYEYEDEDELRVGIGYGSLADVVTMGGMQTFAAGAKQYYIYSKSSHSAWKSCVWQFNDRKEPI